MTNDNGEIVMVVKSLSSQTPLIGILCWEEGCVPQGLQQLESLLGNSTNPDTFQFPVKYSRIKGANVHTILESPCQKVLELMIHEAKKMEEQGVKAITTSCGFNAIFQIELADAVDIPVFTSSLMQVPLVQNMLGKQKKLGVITAKKSALSSQHLKNAGINSDVSLHIQGLESCTEWNKIFVSPDEVIDLATIEHDIINIASLMMEQSDIGAFILECTDLPPFADAIRKVTGRPVFDFVTLTNMVYQSIHNQ